MADRPDPPPTTGPGRGRGVNKGRLALGITDILVIVAVVAMTVGTKGRLEPDEIESLITLLKDRQAK